MRERELKLPLAVVLDAGAVSLPMRERELKQLGLSAFVVGRGSSPSGRPH